MSTETLEKDVIYIKDPAVWARLINELNEADSKPIVNNKERKNVKYTD